MSSYYPAPAAGYVKMLTTGTTLLARDSGNVGIGVLNPASKVDVNGGIRLGNDLGLCTVAKEGTLSWGGGDLKVCSGGVWRKGLRCEYPAAFSDWLGNAYAGCRAGWKILGGGCSSTSNGFEPIYVSMPLSIAATNGWWCGEGAGSAWNQIQAYAICCRFIL